MNLTKKHLIISTIIIVLMLTIITTICLLLKSQNSDQATQVLNSSYPISIPMTQEKSYQGAFLGAELPEGWRITEFTDGAGMQIKSNNNYSGLTGLELFYQENLVFTVKGVSGTGFQDICNPILSFNDTSNNYIDRMKESYMNVKSSYPEVKNLGNKYVELTILGKEVRRIGTDLYWNRNNSDTFFNPECEASAEALRFENIFFYSSSDEGKQKLSWYNVKIMEPNLNIQNLKELDSILSSLTFKD